MSLLSDLGTKIGVKLKELHTLVNGKLDKTGGTVNGRLDVTPGITSRSIDISNTGNRTIQGLSEDNVLGTYGDLHLQHYGGNLHMCHGNGKAFVNDNEILTTASTSTQFIKATARKEWLVSAPSTNGTRNHIARLYGTPNHWNSDWHNIKFTIIMENYESGYIEYCVTGEYGNTPESTWQLFVKDADGSNITGKMRLVLGSAVSAGWNYSGQPVYYVDIYADAGIYVSYKIIADTFGHGIRNTNPSIGSTGITVFYDIPTVTSIGDFNTVINSTSFLGNTIWNSSNDGAGSGLDADKLDGKHASEFFQGTKTISTSTPSGGSHGDVWYQV